MEPFSLGYSPCPNDTFIFYGLAHDLVKTDLRFLKPQLEDVETLNRWGMEKRLDITKLSFHALGHLLDDYCVLTSGSALGRGCGPLLVAAKEINLKTHTNLKIAIPGRYTTAALLFQMFAPQCTNIIELRFEQIMPSIVRGDIDAGVIIHENRFTYGNDGLICLQDLGQWWEETSGQPIPLGCIAVKRSFGEKIIHGIDDAVRKSLEFAHRNPTNCLSYIRKYSQEMDEKVVQDHIGLYVNTFSLNLGGEGMQAVESFLKRGREVGILPKNGNRITI